MANPEHLSLVKQGLAVWTDWNETKPHPIPDLNGADFSGLDLSNFKFFGADLRGANFMRANLENADLSLSEVIGAHFEDARMFGANLFGTWAVAATFDRADMSLADLTRAHFMRATFREANLLSTHFHLTDLAGADFVRSRMHFTVFSGVDLSHSLGLDAVEHLGPSTIGSDTLFLSQGKISEQFLRGVGIEDDLIDFVRQRFERAFGAYYSTFISYSYADSAFAERLHRDLQKSGVRTWIAANDMKFAEDFPQEIDNVIKSFDKLLLVVTSASLDSDKVRRQVGIALEKEQETNTTVLFPIFIEHFEVAKHANWLPMLEQHDFFNFEDWQNPQQYRAALRQLIRSLTATVAVETAGRGRPK